MSIATRFAAYLADFLVRHAPPPADVKFVEPMVDLDAGVPSDYLMDGLPIADGCRHPDWKYPTWNHGKGICRCHDRMENDYYFLPTGRCLYEDDDATVPGVPLPTDVNAHDPNAWRVRQAEARGGTVMIDGVPRRHNGRMLLGDKVECTSLVCRKPVCDCDRSNAYVRPDQMRDNAVVAAKSCECGDARQCCSWDCSHPDAED